jgi:hypothetical protein
MRSSTEVLEDLLILIELTELGSRIPARSRERWAIDCARRAVGANVEWCGPQLAPLRESLTTATHWLDEVPSDEQRSDAIAAAQATCDALLRRAQTASKGARLGLQRTGKTAEAVMRALECAAARAPAEQVAAVAREAFPNPEDEAASQARRLLLWTRLLPSGPELLVRLDYAESRGRLPADREQRDWIEAQRVLLMADDEAGRLAMVLRHLELLFLPELEKIR